MNQLVNLRKLYKEQKQNRAKKKKIWAVHIPTKTQQNFSRFGWKNQGYELIYRKTIERNKFWFEPIAPAKNKL